MWWHQPLYGFTCILANVAPQWKKKPPLLDPILGKKIGTPVLCFKRVTRRIKVRASRRRCRIPSRSGTQCRVSLGEVVPTSSQGPSRDPSAKRQVGIKVLVELRERGTGQAKGAHRCRPISILRQTSQATADGHYPAKYLPGSHEVLYTGGAP